MATARRTATNESISTFGGATRNYTSVATWEDVTDVDLVATTTSYVLEMYNDAASYNEGNIDLAGGVVNGTYFRIIRPAAGSGTNGSNWHGGKPASGIYFAYTGNSFVIKATEGYAHFQDFTVKLSSADTKTAVQVPISGVCVGIIVADSSASNGGQTVTGISVGASGVAVDCLSHNNSNNGFALGGGGAAISTYCYNCTATNNAGRGFQSAGSNASSHNYRTNCLASDNTVADFADGGAGVQVHNTNCASKDATADDWGGSGNRINQTFTFVNAGANDFHLSSSDTGALNHGTDLSADGSFAFNDDIDKDTRSGTWDIGFDEYIPPPTTIAPTTLAPTTLAPTLPPTTLAPPTTAPTTLEPTTLAPPTLPPTTLAPPTLPPTTLAPPTLPPTTIAPPTLAPTTLAPTPAPTTLAPTTVVIPTTLPSTTLAPTTVIVTTVAPTTLVPTFPPTTTLTTAPPPALMYRRGIRNFGFSMRDDWR